MFSRLRFHPPVMARRNLSAISVSRNQLLLKIYKPFASLEKNSPEYRELALSGRVWEDYHQPGNSELQGYRKLQQVRLSTGFE